METTFTKLKEVGACTERYKHLARALGGIRKYGKDTLITALQILECNGIEDCLWAARLMPNDRLWRHFAADCAEQVLPIFERRFPADMRPRQSIQAARDFADGKIDAAAGDAAGDAARAAAGDAARAAAWAAAWDAAGDAAWAAAGAAARAWQAKRLRWYLTECEWGPKQTAKES